MLNTTVNMARKKIEAFMSPPAGRYYNASKDQYEYRVGDKVMGTLSFEAAMSMTKEQLAEFDRQIWSEILDLN